MTHFLTLGLPRSATLADVKKAHRRLVRLLHPDLGTATASKRENAARLARINAAYEKIKSEERLEVYRAELALLDAADGAAQAAGAATNGSRRSDSAFARTPFEAGRTSFDDRGSEKPQDAAGGGQASAGAEASKAILPGLRALFLAETGRRVIRLFVDAPLPEGMVTIRLPRYVRSGMSVVVDGYVDKTVWLAAPVRAGEILDVTGAVNLALVRGGNGAWESWHVQIEVFPAELTRHDGSRYGSSGGPSPMQIRAKATARFRSCFHGLVACLLLPLGAAMAFLMT